MNEDHEKQRNKTKTHNHKYDRSKKKDNLNHNHKHKRGQTRKRPQKNMIPQICEEKRNLFGGNMKTRTTTKQPMGLEDRGAAPGSFRRFQKENRLIGRSVSI